MEASRVSFRRTSRLTARLYPERVTFAARQRLLRLWTVLLCLVASFAYLTREPQTGLPDLNGAPSLAAPTGMTGMDMSGDMGGMDMDQAAHAAHDHPSAPVNPAHHAAHCPFCFSAAFALEAQGFVLALTGAIRSGFLCPPYPHPHLLAARHAEARAPPRSSAEDRCSSFALEVSQCSATRFFRS